MTGVYSLVVVQTPGQLRLVPVMMRRATADGMDEDLSLLRILAYIAAKDLVYLRFGKSLPESVGGVDGRYPSRAVQDHKDVIDLMGKAEVVQKKNDALAICFPEVRIDQRKCARHRSDLLFFF